MKLLAIDSNSLLNRAFYGIRLLTTKDGLYTNAIYGFLNILLKMLEDTAPDAVAFAFDLSGPTFRHEKFEAYKAGRKGMPDELHAQFPIVKELLAALGYKIVEKQGYEADDILGTLAEACRKSGDECIVATGDRDSLQLIGENVSVRLATTQRGQPTVTLYDTEAFQEKYGILPDAFVDVKALMGDSSDNIPGVAGIGEKTALSLISKYGSLDSIYENLDALEITKSVRAKLENGRESAFMSRELAQICKEVPIDAAPAHYRRGTVDAARAKELFARLEMFKMAEKFDLDAAEAQAPAPAEAAKPESEPALSVRQGMPAAELLEKARRLPAVSYWARYDKTALAALAVCLPGEIVLLTCGDDASRDTANRLLADGALPKQTCNSKSDYRHALCEGYEMQNIVFDVSLAAYLLNPNASGYDLERLAQEYAVQPPAADQETLGEQAAADCKNAWLVHALSEKLRAELDAQQMLPLFRDIELALARVLASMEHLGFAVDTAGIQAFGADLDTDINQLEAQIWKIAGYEFNINSPKQLGSVLFDTLGLPTRKKTKTGYSTSAEVLESLRPYHEIIDMILAYRQVIKLKSTYVDGLLKVVGEDGRIHTNFNQTETRTGRISSTEPNLQNIPVRTERGSQLRKFFIAKEGSVLVDADYSQIELRVLASISEDQNMIRAFQSGEDIHTNTASQVFGVPKELMTPLVRSRAKAVNFGIVYGIGAFSLSKNIHVSVGEADQYIKSYLETYSGVKQYMDETIQNGRKQGYVTTLFGRRRYLPELASSNKITKAFGERVAMNTPIQGTAADIIKIAMIRVYDRLRSEKLTARLILQVHDELIVECPENEAAHVQQLLKEEMEHAVSLAVPMEVDAHVGRDWYTAKG